MGFKLNALVSINIIQTEILALNTEIVEVVFDLVPFGLEI
jgi:hypothetical protein